MSEAPTSVHVMFAIAVGLIGAYFGYVMAHAEVARECDRLGGFYVGNSTYVCKLK